ncbi:MAG: type II toxin-antitoxin system VapC family toxin [Austwickia sp.]|nr:type II toxin-antitoxin system VapC family toxin [Actinomycetota bacterium]MCB1252100.1 type II toxin-antitoxin system VapC family toxin [Austwickia sp.]MCO5310174.1 type II toxin-antitoxin system VapC family toxin [Austwickia sp.]
MRVYVDTSAVLPRLFDEPATALTAQTYATHHRDGDSLVTSALTLIEASRATRARRRREGRPDPAPDLSQAMADIVEYPIDSSVIHLARTIGPDALRSLDAIHLATAVAVGADVMFTYDARLAEAARDWGLAVEPA